jgi:hypothetical protein
MGMNCLLVCSRSADWSKVQCENEQDNSLKKTEPNVNQGVSISGREMHNTNRLILNNLLIVQKRPFLMI